MKAPKKLLIFDGTFRTTTFINRRAASWAKTHRVYIAGFNEQLDRKVPGVTYVALGSNQNKWRLLLTSLLQVFRSKAFHLLMPTLRSMVRYERRKLQQQNLDLALERIAPDEIHLQWPSVIPWFENTLTEQRFPVYLWQRGYHINVRPFVDAENMAYLQKWFPRMAGFISVSQAISEVGDTIWNSPSKNNRVIYTNLPLEAYPFSETYRREDTVHLLSVGRNHWKKGYDYALRACALLKQARIPFRYTIIGAEMMEECLFLRNNLGLHSEVEFIDQMPHEQVKAMMQKASVLLMPSVEEGLPNVVVEAMALGLPVLSTDVGGTPEVITHGKEGFLFPPRDPQAIADSIKQFILLSGSEIEAIRRKARQRVEEVMDNEIVNCNDAHK